MSELDDRLVAEAEPGLYRWQDLGGDINYIGKLLGILLQDEAIGNALKGPFRLPLSGLPDVISDSYNGSFIEPMTFVVTSNGTTITGTIDKNPSGDLTERFSDGYTTLSSGGTVTLTAGGATAPKKNYIYVLQSNKGVLVASDSDWPSAEHIKVAEVIVQTAALVQSDGILANRNWNDFAKGTDGQGHHPHAWERLRWEHSAYKSGSAVTWTGSGGATLDLAITAGKAYQLHLQDVSAFDTTDPGKVYVVNQPAPNAYTATADIETLTVDSGNDPLSNKYYNLVIWASVSSGSEAEKVFINLPSGSYTKQGDATSDVSGYDNYSIPSGFRGYGYLVQRVTIKHSTGGGGTWTIIQETDLRGSVPTVAVGSGTASITTEFADTQFRIFDDGNPTREIAFQASSISASTVRTVTVPDKDLTLIDTADAIAAVEGEATLDLTGDVSLLDNKKIKLGAGSDGELYSSGDDVHLHNVTQDADLVFGINDGGASKTITWDADIDRLKHSNGTFNFDDDDLRTTGDVYTGNVAPLNGKEIQFYDVGNSNYVGFKAPALTSNQIWILPTADGNASDFLQTNGSGTLTWAVPYTDADAIAAIEGEATLDLTGLVTITRPAAGTWFEAVITGEANPMIQFQEFSGVPVIGLGAGGASALDVYLSRPSANVLELAAGDTFNVDTIAETTAAAGVTIDSVLLKDGTVDGVDIAARDHAQAHGPSQHTEGTAWRQAYYDASGDEALLALPAVGSATAGYSYYRAEGASNPPAFQEVMFEKSITAENPTATEDITICFFHQAVTVREIEAVVRGTSPSVTINPKHHTDRSNAGNVLLSVATAVVSQSGVRIASWSDNTLPADSWLWLETTAKSGTVAELHLTIRYTID